MHTYFGPISKILRLISSTTVAPQAGDQGNQVGQAPGSVPQAADQGTALNPTDNQVSGRGVVGTSPRNKLIIG